MQTALRYELRRAGQPVVELAIAAGETRRVRMPDPQSKARLLAALLDARCGQDEELELFGERVRGQKEAQRERLRARVGAVTPVLGLISSLNAWENIALPTAYHGTRTSGDLALTAAALLRALGIEPQPFMARLPDEMGLFDRKLTAFLRLLSMQPELAVFDALGDGLSREENARTARFVAEYRARQPAGTLVMLDVEEEEDG
jgi:predicted ABC-type transport system involved in lysophospholipase L1 biosynthesis ATPase subunit